MFKKIGITLLILAILAVSIALPVTADYSGKRDGRVTWNISNQIESQR